MATQPRESNLDVCIDKLQNLSADDPELRYTVRPFLINSLWFGLPQSRTRVYMVGIQNVGTNLHPTDFLETVEKYMKLLHMKPCQPVTVTVKCLLFLQSDGFSVNFNFYKSVVLLT